MTFYSMNMQMRSIIHLWMMILFITGSMTNTAHAGESGADTKLYFDQITSIDGLSNNTVFDIAQDAEGFIWIATREGLNKYNGLDINNYYKNGVSGVPGNIVEQLLVTSDGRLIVGTSSGIGIYHKESDNFTTLQFEGRSMGNVNRIIEIASGDILISTDEGLFLMDPGFNINKISSLIIRDLCEYRTNIIWGLYEDEILLMNKEGEVIRRFAQGMENVGEFDMSSENIECIFKDSKGIIWIGTKRDGLGYYDPDADRFHTLEFKLGVNPIEDNFIRTINEDVFSRLWIGTESGLYIYNVETEDFAFYGQSFFPAEKGLNDKAIYSIFRSKDDMMWIGTYFGGVNYTTLFPSGFNRIYADGGLRGLSGNAVSEIIETSDGRLWIGTEDGGISIYDPDNGKFEYFKHIHGVSNSLPSNNVHALEEDKDGNVWIGTFIGGLCKFNSRTRRLENVELVPPLEEMEEDVYSKSLFSILIDSKQRIWVGSIQGLYMRETENNKFEIWNPAMFRNNFIYHIEEDHSGNLWICTYNQGIFKIDPGMNVSNYRTGSNHDILSNRIIFCYVDTSNIIWFGTVEGGLVKYNGETGGFKSYTTDHGLPNNTVYAITKEDRGYLWLSTNRGISRFDPVEETFVNYSENDGLIGNQFNFRSGITSSDGIIYFGAVNGLTYFDPGKLRNNTFIPEVHFTDLKISNKSVNIGEQDILSSHIDFQDEIWLKYQQKVFTIDFVALNYVAPNNVEYAYYLEGLEQKWNEVGNKRNATYTNLSPGKYLFHLKADNGNQSWPENERNLVIHISPPFWLSPLGFMIYGLVIISSIILIIRFYWVRQKEKMNVRLATLEKQKNEEISQHRLNFFTYISHEFKTPLTLILAALEHIMNYEEILPRFKEYGLVMRKNTMRLLFLINQLMDFRKIETDHAALKYNKGEIIGFLSSTFLTFKPLMDKLSIKSRFTSNVDSYIMYFDADKLEKILTNLISNSCKSFREPGTISIDVKIMERSHMAIPFPADEKTGEMVISICDDGPGLPPEKLKKVFEPFVSETKTGPQNSGIGLALVNSLVRYLNGQISINCPPRGGTKVVIELPLIHNPSPDLLKDSTFIESNTDLDLEKTSLFMDLQPDVEFDYQANGTVKEYELMVVEDNKELASFLQHHYSSAFKVMVANDGAEALKKIKKVHPDVIISDIMMPRMDGFALCNAVKDSIGTCHIPVILLTSRNNFESKIEGLHRGADAYLAKPFSLKELDLHVRNILQSRENLRKHFLKLDGFHKSVGKLGNKDQMFVQKLIETVHRHLDDGTFDVEKFCKEVNISRTLMHMKLKKITGLSTTEFIKSLRLNEARKMLLEGNLTVSEITYRVGFNDPAYFSKSFKKQFGTLPSSVSREKQSSL